MFDLNLNLTNLMIAAVVLLESVIVTLVYVAIKKRQMHLWLPSYFFPSAEQQQERCAAASCVRAALADSPQQSDSTLSFREDDHAAAPLDVFFAICDHYEPRCYGVNHETAIARVDRWCVEYPRLFERFHDSDGRVPQHSFFFPQDEYHPEYLDRLADLCGGGWGDVDIHLHHDNDTAAGLRDKLEEFRDTLFHRHGLLRRDPLTGEIVYGFIHGNWALCNCRPDGRWCGVDQELTVLRETGCYADFTSPSAPCDTQTRTINSIYYATDIPGQRKSHDSGIRARVGVAPPDEHLLMIQGSLGLDWSRRKFGLIPRIENADIHAGFAPTWKRMQLWLKAGVHVAGRPNWVFVKLHSHGCKNGNIDTLLGDPTVRFHQELSDIAEAHPRFRYHYVTAWEMAQLVHAAERGETSPDILSHQPTTQPREKTLSLASVS